MAFQFKDSEKASKGVKRLVLRQIDKASEQLKRPPRNAEAAVHDARVCFKKVRAVLRLGRGAIAHSIFKKQDKQFRDLGRQLSKVRDRDVSVETFDNLVERFHDQLEPKAFSKIRTALVRSKQPRNEKKSAMARLEKELVSVRRGVKRNLSLNRHNFQALRPGLKQLYRDGRQMLAKANKTRTIDDLHEWRKQVKSLMYVIRLLNPVWPPMATTLTEQLEQLANYLSEDHDLALLRETLKQFGQNQEEEITEIEALLALIDRRRAELETESESLGKRIYVERPSAFVTRFEDYWARWRSERRLGPPALAGSPNLNPKSQ